MLELRQ